MSHTAPTSPPDELSDRAVSLIRSSVPALWGWLVAQLLAWLATVLPSDLAGQVADALSTPAVIALATTVATIAWYALWRWGEPHVPAWVIRLVLGSARTPTYAPTADGVAQITDLGAEDRLQLGMLRDFLDEGDPCRDALGRVLRT